MLPLVTVFGQSATVLTVATTKMTPLCLSWRAAGMGFKPPPRTLAGTARRRWRRGWATCRRRARATPGAAPCRACCTSAGRAGRARPPRSRPERVGLSTLESQTFRLPQLPLARLWGGARSASSSRHLIAAADERGVKTRSGPLPHAFGL